MTQLDQLAAAVARMEGAQASAVALLKNLSTQIMATGGDMGRLRALTDELNAKADVLAQAVATYTPPEEPPAPVEEEPAGDPGELGEEEPLRS